MIKLHASHHPHEEIIEISKHRLHLSSVDCAFRCARNYVLVFVVCCVVCCRWRPYRIGCTGSLSTSEVKRRRARLVLGWGTAWEDLRVLSAFCFPMSVFVGADSLDVCFVVCCVHFFQIVSISLFLLAGGARQIKGGT